VLRSMRLGEADRILHLYTSERGRVSAVAKGIRKTKSRYGARLEPLSHVAIQLHQGTGELQTVTGVDLISSHSTVRDETYRLNVGLIGAEAMLRLFTEQEKNERAFTALAKFLEALEQTDARSTRPAVDALALSFQLKLLWLSGYLPHLTSCAECGAADVPLVGYSPKAEAPSAARARRARCRSARRASRGSSSYSYGRSPRHTPRGSPTAPSATRSASSPASYEYHGGFRLRTLSA